MAEKSKPAATTQQYLSIAEIRDDVVIMKDGTMRAILLVSSINFSLKSEEEQEAIISGYVQFLNSIDYPLQIIIQSRKMDIEGYLDRLNQAEKEQPNELLKVQIADYRSFIGELVDLGDIMSKRFYIVVPFDPAKSGTKNFYSRVMEAVFPSISKKLKTEEFKNRKRELMLRAEHVIGGLQSMSLQASALDTQSLIELYYGLYNPELGKSQKVEDITKLDVE
jgi:hypothetical protein